MVIGIGNPSSIRKMRAPQAIETAGSIRNANGIKRIILRQGLRHGFIPMINVLIICEAVQTPIRL